MVGIAVAVLIPVRACRPCRPWGGPWPSVVVFALVVVVLVVVVLVIAALVIEPIVVVVLVVVALVVVVLVIVALVIVALVIVALVVVALVVVALVIVALVIVALVVVARVVVALVVVALVVVVLVIVALVVVMELLSFDDTLKSQDVLHGRFPHVLLGQLGGAVRVFLLDEVLDKAVEVEVTFLVIAEFVAPLRGPLRLEVVEFLPSDICLGLLEATVKIKSDVSIVTVGLVLLVFSSLRLFLGSGSGSGIVRFPLQLRKLDAEGGRKEQSDSKEFHRDLVSLFVINLLGDAPLYRGAFAAR